ncbi:hypothetical protein GCM10020221_16150 [Streptomyces thioluteus]|uniref:Sugar ABC transporter permease n=1 Tax=Streptomyces thioluteus TaxID=66431 RepID=A0ABN3WLB9_STRTU
MLLLGWIMVENGLLSFQNLNRRQLIRRTTEWTGLSNYTDTLGNSEFWRVTLRSIVFTAANVVLIMLIGCLIGLLLARLGKKLRLLLSLGLVLAWAMPTVAATTVFQWLFAQRFGVVNYVLDRLGWHSMARLQLDRRAVLHLLRHHRADRLAVRAVRRDQPLRGDDHHPQGAPRGRRARRRRRMEAVHLGDLPLSSSPSSWRRRSSKSSGSSSRSPRSSSSTRAVRTGSPRTLPVYAFVEGMNNQHFGMGSAISILTILILVTMSAYYLRLVLKQEEDEL